MELMNSAFDALSADSSLIPRPLLHNQVSPSPRARPPAIAAASPGLDDAVGIAIWISAVKVLVSVFVDVAEGVDIAMLVRAEDDTEDWKMRLDIWNLEEVVSERVVAIWSLVEDSNEELVFWFVDAETFAGFPNKLESLLDIVVWEAVPLKLVAPVNGEVDLLVLDESDGTAELWGIFSPNVVAAVNLPVEVSKGLGPLLENSLVAPKPWISVLNVEIDVDFPPREEWFVAGPDAIKLLVKDAKELVMLWLNSLVVPEIWGDALDLRIDVDATPSKLVVILDKISVILCIDELAKVWLLWDDASTAFLLDSIVLNPAEDNLEESSLLPSFPDVMSLVGPVLTSLRSGIST